MTKCETCGKTFENDLAQQCLGFWYPDVRRKGAPQVYSCSKKCHDELGKKLETYQAALIILADEVTISKITSSFIEEWDMATGEAGREIMKRAIRKAAKIGENR